MDFVTGALPNVMFIAGLIAIGIGLGIEFKIVEIKSELSKGGRIGAIGIGAVLVLISIYLYTRPPQTASVPATVSGAQPPAAQANAGAVVSAPPPAPTQAAPAQVAVTVPSPTAVPPTVTSAPPTATAIPPTATKVPPTATAMPGVAVPDIRGQNTRDAQKKLEALGLRLGERRERCEDIGATDDSQRKLKKDQIRCQSPAPGAKVAPNTPVLYVLAGK